VIAPNEVPVGVMTALIGGPFFIWILLHRSRTVARISNRRTRITST
jgi:iron complex transport system permease protein